MVIHFLRRVSLCLWISLLITGFCSFGILTLLQPEVGTAAAPLLFAGLLLAVFAAVAWTANRLGTKRVQRLMNRADRAEREGLRADAENAFQSALGALDSFWVSLRVRQRMLLPLVGRMARYYLSESHFSAAAEDFIVRYLWAHPQDEEVAEQWVRHAERQGGLREEHQDLADRLGEAHPLHPLIQRAVARLCLASERTDYSALTAYRRVCTEDGQVPPEFCAALARLFRTDERSYDWAQQVLRQAQTMAPAATDAMIVKASGPSHSPGPHEPSARIDALTTTDEEDGVFCLAGGADDVEEEEAETRTSLLAQPWRGLGWVDRALRQVSAVWGFFCDRLQRGAAVWAEWLRGIRREPSMRWALALLLIVGLAAAGGWMALKRASLFGPSPAETSAVESPSAPAPPASDQFALQVAAYLKQDYALKLVEDLQKKGLNAYWIETASSGKTWFQVRIASFPDQQSAREFGRKLKGKGVIDDFYVTSASR